MAYYLNKICKITFEYAVRYNVAYLNLEHSGGYEEFYITLRSPVKVN
jgi:hypothetical protein